MLKSYQTIETLNQFILVRYSLKLKYFTKAKQCQMDLAEIKTQIYLFSFIFSVPFPRSVTLVKHLLKLAFDLTPFRRKKKKKGKKVNL